MENNRDKSPEQQDTGLTGRHFYNIFSDIVFGVNIRKKDNFYQAVAIVAFMLLGFGIGLFTGDRSEGLFGQKPIICGTIGAFLGTVAGLLFSGTLLMLYRFCMHLCNKHD